MTRKDSEKDSERPHYYSQFWLDVAAGRRVIGAPRPEEGEVIEVEEPVIQRRPTRGGQGTPTHDSRTVADGRAENIVHPVAEPISTPDEFIEPEPETEDYEEQELQDVVVDDTDIPDMDLSPLDEEEEEEDFFEEEEEEDEDDIGWGGGRGRSKKAKPTRPTKAPKKPNRRPGRGF